jgi:MYXO-CTERM domain-containing protein
MRSSRLLKRLSALVLAGGAASSLLPGHASAGWPPPDTATPTDLANPANWPNDPGYAWSQGNDGQWNFYSFMPSIATNVKTGEAASGMSIDMAWRLTIGDDSIHIAITDSGIEWDNDDLIDKVWLNPAELANHKPTHADGSACGGTGALAGFDCNNDGIFSVSDYKDTPTLTPAPTVAGGAACTTSGMACCGGSTCTNGTCPGTCAAGVLGDRNGNGKLDAGDLILHYSDGVDDDGNGYVDDIAGWDFMKDDNNPYDDTRYGHGTGEAEDSTAAANNGIGGAGVCPRCRFIPTRAGDSFITDVTDFGKAIAYGVDNGARIVQCALGTINNNKFAQAALDYAWSKNVLVVTSMADENSKHHNLPAANNHTLPVHAIEYDGSGLSDSTTFLGFNPCSNYGGQNLLSASGTACSSEATGKLSGIVGLVYSAAIKYPVNPPLTPGEVHSIFFSTTDDINVATSMKSGSPYAWSQPGFDQRFGYGRINANNAVEAIRDGKIPPDVDIVSPTWFSVLYKDQAPAMIDVKGTVSAKRATSFDYSVQWGPGVQPLDSQFKPLTSMTNVPSTMVVGGSTPLVTLDLAKINPAHTRDVDSPFGENDTAITVRVQAVAHYGGSIGDVKGEARRTYYVNSDPDLVKGFPIYLGDSGENSPKLADIDGDGIRDLVYPTSGGRLHVYKITSSGPTELPGFPFSALPEDGLLSPAPTASTPVYLSAPAYQSGGIDPKLGADPFSTAPAIGDIDGDGKPEIVLSTWSGTLYAVGSDGTIKPGWPVRLPLVPSCTTDASQPKVSPCMDTQTRIARGSFAAPVLVDLDLDGKPEIVQAAFDGNVYVFHHDGSPMNGYPVAIHYQGSLSQEPPTNRILTTPAVADFNGDGIPDMLVGSNERLGNGGQSGAAYIIDGRGKNAPTLVLPNWPVTMTSLMLFPLVAEGVPNSGVIGTFTGTKAAVMHGNATIPMILPSDPGAQGAINTLPPNALPVRTDPTNPGNGVEASSIFGPLSKATTPDTMLPLFAQPSLGDIDQDGVPDVIASGGSLNLAIALQSKSGGGPSADNLLAVWSGKTGKMLPASPMVLEDFTFFNSQAIADLDNDDYPEIITGSGGYFVHAWNGCGVEPTGWPKFTGQWMISTPAVGDVDGDHRLEVAIASRDGWLYLWHTQGRDDGIVEWESFHHDNANTGNLDTPLQQGTPGKKAATPLTVAACTPPSSSSSSSSSGTSTPSGGGCKCRAGADDPGSGGAAAALLGIGLLATRRRRRAS